MVHEPTALVASEPGERVSRPLRGRPDTASRSLAPREHGAYGQLGLPLVTALAMGRPGLAAVGMTIGAVAAFFAHEPLLIVMGQRGTRAAREDGRRARQRLLLLGAMTALGGGVGLSLAPFDARVSAIVPLVLALALAPFVARGQEKTAAGELLAAATLSGAAVPVAIASGVPLAAAWGAWGAWCLAMGASTLAVRSVIAHARAPGAWPSRVIAPLLALAALAALTAGGALSRSAAIGATPMLALALALAAKPPSPRALKRVCWALVAASVALAVCLAVGARL